MVSTVEGIKLITAETGRLKEYVHGTGPEQWSLDSPCEGWTVGDVIGHLGWAAEFFADAISQGRAGITTAPQGLPEIGTLPLPELPGLIASMAKEYNCSADAQLPDAFASSVDRLAGIFASMEDDDWAKECWSFRNTVGITPPKSNWAEVIDTPPYTGYAVTCGISFTFGGVRINNRGQIVTNSQEPIPGLYAAGEMVGGLFYHNYPGGSGLSAGMVFGKLSGTSAGQDAKALKS